MEATQADSRRSTQGKRKTFRGRIKELIVAVLKWVAIFTLLITMSLGACDLYDICVPEKVPEVCWIGISTERFRANFIANNWHEFSEDPEVNWQNLQNSLKILNKVCPEAARWAEDRHNNGKIIWETKETDTYARYSYFNQTLILNKSILGKKDGEKAVTIAHEFRHSRQNISKIYKCLMLSVLSGTHQEGVIENDAYSFEREVYIAIYGN